MPPCLSAPCNRVAQNIENTLTLDILGFSAEVLRHPSLRLEVFTGPRLLSINDTIQDHSWVRESHVFLLQVSGLCVILLKCGVLSVVVNHPQVAFRLGSRPCSG